MTDQISLKQKVYDVIAITSPDNKVSKFFDIFILCLITANILAVIIETEPIISEPYNRFFEFFELFSVVIFSVEYLLRIWVVNIDPKFK